MKKKKFCSLLPNKKPYKAKPSHLFNKPNNAKWPNKPNKPHLFNKPNNAKWPNKPNKPHLFNKPNNAKWPNKPNKPTYSTNSTKPNGPTNLTTVCQNPSITTISKISTSTKSAKPNNRFW